MYAPPKDLAERNFNILKSTTNKQYIYPNCLLIRCYIVDIDRNLIRIQPMDINDVTQTDKIMATEQNTDNIETGFPIPFTKEVLKQDILNVILVLANMFHFAFFRDLNTGSQIWELLSKRPLDYAGAIGDPDMTPEALGLSFQDVENMAISEDLLEFYDFGVHGIVDTTKPSQDDSESSGNWLSRILVDLKGSHFLEDWSGYTHLKHGESIDRCIHTLELANARMMLEGGSEGFFLGHQDKVLTIRQMALLSGMTEASIRTLSGPNRNNRLITKKDGSSTYVEIADAVAWLISKGRYITIKRTVGRGAEIFTNRKMFSADEFEEAIEFRRAYLSDEIGSESVNARLEKTGLRKVTVKSDHSPVTWQVIGSDQLLNTELMKRLGEALQLPPDTFALRAAEAVMHEKLREVEQQLKQISQPQQ